VRPGPRIQAAIEVLEAIDAGGDAADRIVAAYFRRRRYAGSKDRAAVIELVYTVLRHHAWLNWRLAHARAGLGDVRLMVIAQLVDGGVPDAEIAALFDGSDHAPEPLKLEESAVAQLLRQPPSGAPPPSVAGNYPGWLHGALERRFGPNLAAEMAALNRRAPLDVRVNSLKADRDTVLARLAADGFEAHATPFSRVGIRLTGLKRLESHPLYREGDIEIQDEGSQIVAALVGARPGERVVDYCAGAGGKTLALSAMMGDLGEIIACDTGPTRLRNLGPRLARAGVNNVRTCSLAEDEIPLGEAARVLLDVPCSGTGAWRRRPEARWRISQEKLHEYNKLQDDLLVKGSALTAPGGTLVYATCSVLQSEGADRVETFLRQTVGFELVDVDALWPSVLDGERPGQGPYVDLSPASTGTDGFFIAALRRSA
jgi:16S rRNA (cytosine967-C5)-methyltransferase